MSDLKNGQDAQKATEDKLWKVGITLGASKDKLKIKTDELEKKTNELGKEKEKLVEDLRAEWKAVEDESEDVKDLATWAELVEKIEALRLYSFEMGRTGFEITVDQLKVLNFGILIKDIGLKSKIVGHLIPGEPEEEEE